MSKQRRSKRIWFACLGVFVAVSLFTFLVQKYVQNKNVGAVSAAGFNAAYIISDYQMTNYGSMSEAQIQSFLKSQNGCNDTNFSRAISGTRVSYYSEISPPLTWHIRNNHYVCMADENINGESAAHIIWKAAQDYKINPQVLIVLLQKEQGLVEDTFPYSGQYRSATGYGCPDTAKCNSEYYGFKNQVRNAASLFRYVMDGKSNMYVPGRPSTIAYNTVNSGCGQSSQVTIQNWATSALYRYTPYQPNAASLAAGFGLANDRCAAYGNRNFYLYFQKYFGNITWDGFPSVDKIDKSADKVKDAGSDLGVQYRANLNHYGWRGWTTGAKAAGSVGYSIQMEAFQLKLKNGLKGIEYRAHMQDVGWMDYVSDSATSGITKQSKRLEAIQIRLTGEIAKRYDVYYRTHVQDIGWTKWAKNDEVSGTIGKSKQVEAIQVRLVKKDLGLGPEYSVHAEDYGWMKWVKNAKLAGTTGQSKRLEAIKIKLPIDLKNPDDGTAIALASDDLTYRVHAQDHGWMKWVKNGEMAGTTGQSKRLEAIEIKLSEKLAAKYDIYYRVHAQDHGWMKWVKNGEMAGTTGQSKRLEAIEIELVAK